VDQRLELVFLLLEQDAELLGAVLGPLGNGVS